ncbi:MAG: O-antigen ligase family protein [Ignavibacteria bacterium]|nr:O-antigen ligase family protein [Ignavibacteria bacterium]
MILLFGIILPKFIYNTGYFLKLVNIISTFGFLTALFGFFLYFSGYKPLATAEYLISFIRHPNGVSIILSLTSLATIYYYFAKLDELTLFKKYFYFISFILQFFAELLTQSRTGILALVIALSVFFSFYYRKKIIILFPIAVISVKIFILDYILKKGSASFISRARLWLVAIDLLEKSRQTFIWGYGYTEGNKLFQKNAFYFTEIVEHPHNAYISLTLMFGIIFLAVFILYILFLLIRNFYIEFKHKEKKIQLFINFITSTMLLILLQGIFESPMVLYWYFLMPIFIMFLGLNHLMNNKNYQFDNFLKSNSNLI